MKKQIDLYVISGFLGSGKTTFLTHFMDSFTDKKVGILVNELGTVSIDGMVIEQNGITMTEITNGSIYCYCKHEDFIRVLKAFSTSDIDVLIIENSGMADPSNIHRLLREGEDDRKFTYKGAICVLDAMTFLNHVAVLPSIQNQVYSSNFVVLNKVDLVNQRIVEACKEKVKELNPKAYIIETIFSQVQALDLEMYLKDNGFDGETTNKCYNKFMSYSLECEEVLQSETMEAFVEAVKSKLYRLKGFVKTEDTWLQVDAVEEQVFVKEVVLHKRQKLNKTKLVVIGKDGEDFKEWLLEKWNEICQVEVTLYE
ncbi:MAG: GTP-binding protein [Eubacteriales bacterium]